MVVPFQIMEFTHSLFSVLTLVTVPFIPESPVFLLSRGKLENAEKSLKWLRGGGDDVDVGDEMKEARAKKLLLGCVKHALGSRNQKLAFLNIIFALRRLKLQSPSTSFSG